MNALADLLHRPPAEQAGRGYADTAREVAQQPETWLETARTAVGARPELRAVLRAADIRPGGAGLLILTGSARVSSCLLYTSPSPRDRQKSRMPSSA